MSRDITTIEEIYAFLCKSDDDASDEASRASQIDEILIDEEEEEEEEEGEVAPHPPPLGPLAAIPQSLSALTPDPGPSSQSLTKSAEMDPQSFYSKRIVHHKSLRDAIESLEDENIKTADIVVTGVPEGGNGSDEEDIIDDDLDPSGVPDEIAAEVDTMTPVEDDEEMEDIEDTERRDKPRWMKKNIERKEMESESGKEREYASQKLSQNFPALSSSNEWDIFIKVFNVIIELLVLETNRYAKQENCQSFEVTLEEMMNFIGLLFLSGYNTRLNEKEYWSKAQDLECPIFAETMSRNRFQEIKKFLHCADNANLGNEKMAKVKPLYDLLNENIRQFGILHEILSIGEFMIPYYGYHSCKQFIKQKQIRFGFKSWILASSTGMPYYVKIYEGKSENQSSNEPFGSRVIQECISACSEPTNHRFYFDSQLTSYDKVLDLKRKEINATGTIRSNRTKHCPLPSAKDMKKKPRGSYDYRSEGNVEIVTWNDNAVVTLCSNCEGINPIGMAKRWQRGVGRVNIEQPFIVKAYNKAMVGVDLFDRALSDFRPAIRGKKWYYPLIIAALNTGMVFCWRLYEISTGTPIPNKEYRRYIVQILVKRGKPERMGSQVLRSGPKGSKALPPREVRTDNTNHRAESLTTPRRCVVCKKNGKIQCTKCDVTLHLRSCWQIFHEK